MPQSSLPDATAQASVALAAAHKAQQNREAARLAAAVAIYYQQRVDPESESSIAAWLDLMIPRLMDASDSGARRAASYFDASRRLELRGVNAPQYAAQPSLGMINAGVRQSLLTTGPFAYTNKIRKIEEGGLPRVQRETLARVAKDETTKAVAAAVVRHAQAGGRQTLFENSARDRVALGWIRVTRAKPCAFCAMLASRGIQYRAFKEGSFDEANLRFTGVGDAKVHDECGCSLKPVYVREDPMLDQNKNFMDMWERWGAGGKGETRPDLRFRRGYDHWARTGELLPWEVVDAA